MTEMRSREREAFGADIPRAGLPNPVNQGPGIRLGEAVGVPQGGPARRTLYDRYSHPWGLTAGAGLIFPQKSGQG
jgi:hypothetical protein